MFRESLNNLMVKQVQEKKKSQTTTEKHACLHMILMILGVETDRENLWSKSCSTAYPHFSSPNAAVAISITDMPEMLQSTVDSGPTFSSLFIPAEHILHN